MGEEIEKINITTLISQDVRELLLQESYSSSKPSSPNNGSLITLIVGTLPIISLCLIILGFKICYKLCPQGQRREFNVSRRISMLSSFSSMSRASSLNQMVQHSNRNSSSSLSIQGQVQHGSGSHLSLHHVHSHHHYNLPPTVRADGTPLIAIELETIADEPEDELEEGRLSFTARPLPI